MSCSVCAGYSSYNCPCCGEPVRMMTCPDCKGSGMEAYKAYHIHRHITTDVTKICYDILPKDEDDAIARGENWCRWPRERCHTCKGEGEIPEDY